LIYKENQPISKFTTRFDSLHRLLPDGDDEADPGEVDSYVANLCMGAPDHDLLGI
jgi:hypothetical protein